MLHIITKLVGVEWVAIIIIAFTLGLFLWDRLPISVTALISSLLLALFGCMKFSQVYAGFSSTLVMLVFGMMIVGEALFQTGVVILIGRKILKSRFANNERFLIVVLSLITGIISAFLSNTATIATFIPLVGAMVVASKGKLTNKNILMPLGMATSVGGTLTLVGSTAQPMVNSVLIQYKYPGIGMFDFAIIALPCFILLCLYLGTIGYKIEQKCFTFPDIVEDVDISEMQNFKPHSKTYIAAAIMILCIIGFVTEAVPMAIVALIGAATVIVTGCVNFKDCMRRLDWNTVLLMAFAQGIAAGMNDSGAGKMIAQFTVHYVGGNMTVMYLACIVLTVALTNVMSNTAVAAMMTPIYIVIAETLGYNPYVFALGIAVASNISIATPIGGTAMSQTLVGGYKFNDYLKLGLPITVIMTIVMMAIGPMVLGFAKQ